MKALTLYQPWASAIALGVKRWETRSWAMPYRGPGDRELDVHGATMKASITGREIELPVEVIEGRRRVVRGGIATGRGPTHSGGVFQVGDPPHGRSVNPAPASLPQSFFVHWTLPGLNELLAACRSVNPRSGWQRYATLKRQVQRDLCQLFRAAKLRPMPQAFLIFTWYERDRRRDPDNIAAGGRKFILDALVFAKILPTDGWAAVRGWSDQFRIDPSLQGVDVQMYTRPPEESAS